MLSNWCDATTTTTGTGTITLASVSGRPLPSVAHAVNEYVSYSIVTSDGKFESGIGQIGSSNTLLRTKPLSTYDGSTYNNLTASALSLAAGTHQVYVTPISEVNAQGAAFPQTCAAVTNACTISGHLSGSTSTYTIPQSQPIAFPFWLNSAGLLTGFSCNVTGTGASSTFHMGLYEQATDGAPGRRLAVTSSTISGTSTGYKTQAAAANARLSPGFYWIAILVTAGTPPQLRSSICGCGPHGIYNGMSDSVQFIRENVASITTLADPFPRTALLAQGGGGGAMNPWLGLLLS